MPDTIFRALQASHAILTTILGRCSDYPHFIDGQTEAQRSRNLLAKATQWYIVEQEFTSRLAQSPPSPHLLSRGNISESPFSHPNIVVTEEGHSSRNRILPEKGMGAPVHCGITESKDHNG